MTSQSQSVNQLHEAYCAAMFLDDFDLNMADERRWLEAADAGLTPADLTLLIRERLKGIRAGDRKPNSVLIRNICGHEEILADALNEIAVIKARGRVKVMDPGKASVLRATGRSDEVPKPDKSKVNMPMIMDALRKAVNE